MSQGPKIATSLIHPDHGATSQGDPAGPRGTSPVLERSSTFSLEGPGGPALATGEGLREVDTYGRFGTRTTREAAALIALLEQGEAALLTASGMAAIATVMTTLIPPGGVLACAKVVYGGTEALIEHELAARGVKVVRFDARDPDSLAALLGGEREPDLVWAESIANPLLEVARMAELGILCRAAEVPLGVDATFTGGMAQHPLALGASIVIHSATKYLNGHSDVIAGAIVGSDALIDRCFSTLKRTGPCIDPMAAWLIARGIRTLPLRWARQCETAALLADRLVEHPAVQRVYWPGFDGAAMRAAPLASPGGMLAFELVDLLAVESFLQRVRLCSHAASLGGLETLLCSPAKTSHAGMDPELRRAKGIADGLVRVSVGIEDPDDLWADLEQALEAGYDA
ncbi:trans-sulfuration enzyme family protein [Nannocystaceae bacterium ST9]